MRWDRLADEDCSIARALAVVGDRWTLLVLRECFLKTRRFEQFQARLGIARRVLTERLASLVAAGVLERVPYQQRPARQEYRLTAKGLALHPVIMSLVNWGDVYCTDERGPPLVHMHTRCGHDFQPVLACSACGEAVVAREVTVRPRAADGDAATAAPRATPISAIR